MWAQKMNKKMEEEKKEMRIDAEQCLEIKKTIEDYVDLESPSVPCQVWLLLLVVVSLLPFFFPSFLPPSPPLGKFL